MRKLTNRFSDGEAFIPMHVLATDGLQAIADKLADYEDLEEQGLLLRLPCKIGDTVYVIPSKSNYELNVLHKHFECNRVYAQKVHSIEIYNSGRYGYTLTTCEGWNRVISDHYGETWFLTQAEAEQALKQMGEREDE